MITVLDFPGPPENRVDDLPYVRFFDQQFNIHWEPFDGKISELIVCVSSPTLLSPTTSLLTLCPSPARFLYLPLSTIKILLDMLPTTYGNLTHLFRVRNTPYLLSIPRNQRRVRLVQTLWTQGQCCKYPIFWNRLLISSTYSRRS